MIKVPAKISRPKGASKHAIPDYYGKAIDVILDYAQCGKCVYVTLPWTNDSHYDDVVGSLQFNPLSYIEERFDF